MNEKGSLSIFVVVLSSKVSPVCVDNVRLLAPNEPYKSLICRYRLGICVVRGSVIVPGLTLVSITATPDVVLNNAAIPDTRSTC
jgi:hypothetical protein